MYSRCNYSIKILIPDEVDTKDAKNCKFKTSRWHRTKPFPSRMGLKQGCSLSPLLANIFLSDLDEAIEENHTEAPKLKNIMISSIAWADDLLITSRSKEGLQKCLDSLSTYCEKWGLVVSMKKTRCVIFSKGHIKYDILQQ